MTDLLAIGRASLDLFSQDIGTPFEQVHGFAAFAGGTPVNVAVGVQRLGLQTALLTGLSDDLVGRFVRHFLDTESVTTAYAYPKPGKNTNAVLQEIQPPDHFPFVPYEHNMADLALTPADVRNTPVEDYRALFFHGMSLQAEPSRSAVLCALERAHNAGALTVMDADYQAQQWHDPDSYGITTRLALRLVDVLVGTESEIRAAAGIDDADEAGRALRPLGRGGVVLTRAVRGATVFAGAVPIDVPPYNVDVLNTMGAGDAFAAGLIYGLLHDLGWADAARWGAACGALIVTRHGCANDAPTLDEVRAFLTNA